MGTGQRPSLQSGNADQRFFFPRPGITLFTAPATDDAIVATTPFFAFRPPERLVVDFDFDFDPALDVVFDFVVPLDFAAAFFAIADTATP